MRYVFAISDAADCGGQTQGDRGARRDRCQDSAGNKFIDDRIAGALLRLQANWGAQQRSRLGWMQACRNLSSGISFARSKTEGRGLEGSADGDEGTWNEDAKIKNVG